MAEEITAKLKAAVKELRAIRGLLAEALQRTSRLEEELVPVQGPAPRKGRAPRKGLTDAQKAVERRNKRIGK